MKLRNKSSSEAQVIYIVPLTIFVMAFLATLGSNLTYVLWSGFLVSFVAVIVWNIARQWG